MRYAIAVTITVALLSGCSKLLDQKWHRITPGMPRDDEALENAERYCREISDGTGFAECMRGFGWEWGSDRSKAEEDAMPRDRMPGPNAPQEEDTQGWGPRVEKRSPFSERRAE